MEQALGACLPPNPSIPERTVHIASLKQLTLRKKHEFKPMELEALHHLGCSSSGYIHQFLMLHPFFKMFKIICDNSSIFSERNLKTAPFSPCFSPDFSPKLQLQEVLAQLRPRCRPAGAFGAARGPSQGGSQGEDLGETLGQIRPSV